MKTWVSVLLLAFATTVAVHAAKALETLTPLKPVLKNEFSETPLKLDSSRVLFHFS